MNYYTHNLRSDLQEWKSRIGKATSKEIGHKVLYFFRNIENSNILNSLLEEIALSYPFSAEKISELLEMEEVGDGYVYREEKEHVSFCYHLCKQMLRESGTENFWSKSVFMGNGFLEIKNNIVENFISPIVDYLQDKLEKSNSILYLLEKYKRRVEWFIKDELLVKYNSAKPNYEKALEKDLQLFLFDQGVDYPFSTPESPSGRADLVGAIETNDPLIVEIKVLDKDKNYGKDRIKGGFTQIVKYTNDYHKDFGYLVIFNLDNVEVNFNLKDQKSQFPPMVSFANKTYFLIVINIYTGESASKVKKTNSIEITEADLF